MKNINKFILTVLLLSTISAQLLSTEEQNKNITNGFIEHKSTHDSSYVTFLENHVELSDPHYSYAHSNPPGGRTHEHVTFLAKNNKRITKDNDKGIEYTVTITNETWREAKKEITINQPNRWAKTDEDKSLLAQALLSSVRVFFKQDSEEVESIQIKPVGVDAEEITADLVNVNDHNLLVQEAVKFIRYARAAVRSAYTRTNGNIVFGVEYQEVEADGPCASAVKCIRDGLLNGHSINVSHPRIKYSKPVDTQNKWRRKSVK